MNCAILSDIHGNLAALQAVLAQVPDSHQIFCCGDLVGYYPDANEVCAMCRDRGVRAVRGNHEAMMLGILDCPPELEVHYRLQETLRSLTQENLAWIRSLPPELTLKSAGSVLRIRHASPWDEVTYLYPDSPRLEEVLLEVGETLCVGHTHHPFIRKAGDGWLVNAGSVGQPRDYDPRACLVLGELPACSWGILRVPYDSEPLQRRLMDAGYPMKSVDLLRRTRPVLN
ncbi:MAG: metallophosphoesterase family protein [Verrucomicrobia bacterium]|nr:metallophosphoesterase family protein [Verrucomicrobiota bacterium]